MIRYAFAAFAVLCSWIAGRFIASSAKESVAALDSLIDLTEYLHRRISAERTPLKTLFRNYDDKTLEKCGFLSVLRSEGDPSALWREAAELLPVSAGTKREIAAFGNGLGRTSLAGQEKKLRDFAETLRDERAKAGAGLKDREKSIRAICLLFGVIAVIILL